MKIRALLAGVSVLLFFSCATVPKVGLVFDDSVPAEQSAQVYTYNIGAVTVYNGISVDWIQRSGSSETIQIPAGDTLLEFDLKTTYGSVNYTGKALFRYNFQPYKRYFFWFQRKEEGKMNIYGLNVYTYEIGEKHGVTWSDFEAHFTEFVPFINTRGDQKTVLE
ncbi:MAG: hypothetical protein LBU85_07985 [Treponema sp.]|nr:hypothetical protein [Treponema sp.]